MSRVRGLVMLLILGAIIGFVAVLRTSAGESESGEAQSASRGGSIVAFGPGTATPSPAGPAAVLIVPPAATESAEPVNNSAGPVTAVPAAALQTAIPINTSPATDATPIVEGWNPPAMGVPIAHAPWDHYWFIRPVAAKHQNFELATYPYGSNGPENDLRIHHGIDLPNPIGVEVMAAGSGTVVMAQKGFINEFETITAYGNCIVIDHDFGYNGQHLYTLYAHLSAILVQKDDRVEAGQVIGLIGNTGQVTGPHVHFEVRVGRNAYSYVRNPVLWMAPYENSGVIAGRIAFPNQSGISDAAVTLIDASTGNIIDRTDTYAGYGVNSDDNWNENFVFPDVPAGRYLVTSTYNTTTWSGTVDVVPGATNWVDLQRYTAETLPISPQATP